MTSATRSVAVVATRLPNTDRRALSQAWYSALHVASPQSAPPAARMQTPPGASAPAKARFIPAAVRPVATAAGSAPFAVHRSGRASSGATPPDRRTPAGDLARRIERAIVRRGPVAVHQTTAIALSLGDGRVQLLVRSDGTATRIVALCPAHLRERVDRALASARFALAAGGTRIEVPS